MYKVIVWHFPRTISWLVFCAALIAPFMLASGFWRAWDFVYGALGHICHQMPSRSLWILSAPFGLCIRCLAIYGSFGIASMVFPKVHGCHPKKWLIVLFLLPLFLDVFSTMLGLRTGDNIFRAVTGVLFGIGSSSLLWEGYQRLNQKNYWTV